MGPAGPGQAVIKEWLPYSRYMQVLPKHMSHSFTQPVAYAKVLFEQSLKITGRHGDAAGSRLACANRATPLVAKTEWRNQNNFVKVCHWGGGQAAQAQSFPLRDGRRQSTNASGSGIFFQHILPFSNCAFITLKQTSDCTCAPAPASDGDCASLYHAANRVAEEAGARLLPHHRLLPRAHGRGLLGQIEAGPPHSKGSPAGNALHGGGRDGPAG